MNCRLTDDNIYSELVPEGELEPLPLLDVIFWNLKEASEDIPRKKQIKGLKRAFLRIQQVIPVKFRFIEGKGEIQMTVSSTDNYFKTRRNALAYAFVGTTSQEIDLVFNESYFWVLNLESGVNRYDMEVVGIHEICHVLGLNHSMNPKSVMYPNYQGIKDLDKEDIEKLHEIWGVRSGWSFRLEKLKGYLSRLI